MATAPPGNFGSRAPSASIQAAAMTKPGLANSEGCSDMPAKYSQRFAPFTSPPKISKNTISAIAPTNTNTPSRRACNGVKNAIAVINSKVGPIKTSWRMGNWN